MPHFKHLHVLRYGAQPVGPGEVRDAVLNMLPGRGQLSREPRAAGFLITSRPIELQALQVRAVVEEVESPGFVLLLLIGDHEAPQLDAEGGEGGAEASDQGAEGGELLQVGEDEVEGSDALAMASEEVA
ncbi:unnamed protein product [Closterium sp. NIES-65]|nr:unnamed protein product [Closterium sp. NIES-65]